MEASLLGLGRKNNKATKLHHDLQINILKEDCKNFDIFLGAYCFISIAYKIIWYALQYDEFDFTRDVLGKIEIVIFDLAGMLIWIFGLIISSKSLIAYSLMKCKTIRKNAKKLIWYIFFQTLYFFLCFGFMANNIFISNDLKHKQADWNGKILIFSLLLLIIFSTIFISLYFHSQKNGLAEEIQKFDTTSNKKNAAYVKPTNILDI